LSHPPILFELIYERFHGAISIGLQATLVCTLVVLVLAFLVRNGLSGSDDGIIPSEKLTLRNFMELLLEGIINLAKQTMGDKWPTYLPLVGTLGLFILVSNLMGLVPFFTGPTSFIETNLTWALFAFAAFNYAGIREHGFWGYVKSFYVPVPGVGLLIWVLEVFGAVVRIGSLTIRLTANMFADHTLVAVFLSFPIVSLFAPSLVMGLGLFVAFVQAFIFSFLTMVYIGLALEAHH
jgi:F-type H+-transporting ATPase subunit a